MCRCHGGRGGPVQSLAARICATACRPESSPWSAHVHGCGGSGRTGCSNGSVRPAYLPTYDKIDDAATKLSAASYPFLKEIDWTSPVYGSLPNANPVKVLAAINAALVMGASMDSAALKAGVMAHAKAIGHVDSRGMIPLPDYTEINAAIGHMVASVPEGQVIDVFNAFSDVVKKEEVGAYMKSLVNSGDAEAAYQAFWEFKNVVAAAQR
ncbi:unnamed protein product [Polarella glacialis]|uniref:Peridinin chlorophyll-a binding protein apoprotein n=1 Tax=Polarella glacialis TaxID=89957 RepID=A0A813FJR1_POLGL|nr:unnamed protein product [Polarella glacialis]